MKDLIHFRFKSQICFFFPLLFLGGDNKRHTSPDPKERRVCCSKQVFEMSHEGNDFSYQSRKTPTFQSAYLKETEGRLILNGKAIKKSWEHQAPAIAFSIKTQNLPSQLFYWEERICLKQRHKAQAKAFWNISVKNHISNTLRQLEFKWSFLPACANQGLAFSSRHKEGPH